MVCALFSSFRQCQRTDAVFYMDGMRMRTVKLFCRPLLQPLGRCEFGQSSPPGFSSTHEVVGLDGS